MLAPRLLGDADIGWHIRNGELILQNHAVTRTDPFSSVMGGKPWYAWEWLFDLTVAALHHWRGLNAVVFFAAVVIALTFAVVFRFTVARGASLPVAVLFLVLTFSASTIHLFARPHVVSWLLTIVWFLLLDSGNARRALYWLPLLMLFWANLHGGLVAGFALLGLYLAGAFLELVVTRDSARKQAISKRLTRLSATAVLTLLVSTVNPYGYELDLHIYRYLSDRFLMNNIDEFLSPNFHGLPQQCFAVLLLLTIVTLAASRRKPTPSQLLVLVFAAYSGLFAARNVPVSSMLLMLIAAPLLSQTINAAATDQSLVPGLRGFLSRYRLFTSRMEAMDHSLRGHLWPCAALLAGIWICAANGRLGERLLMNAHFDGSRFPAAATDVIAENHIRGPVLCPDSWGGYLIYRLYPQTSVFMDDRHDLFGDQTIKRYLIVMRVAQEWKTVIDVEKLDWVLVPEGSSLANVLKQTPPWTIISEDQTAVLFHRSEAEPATP